MKTPPVSDFRSMGARYCPWIAGALLLQVALGSGPATAGISHAHIEQVWQEVFGSPAQTPLPFSTGTTSQAERLTVAPPPPAALVQVQSNLPHPAVARIVVPEAGAVSYGSGSLVDVREKYGLVITNWHVVRDATGEIEVIFPNGFTSKARALKVDPDWDLAALVIWRPQIEPVEIATRAPRPGDQLTICGYGPGIYRSATGRCTQYYSPKPELPHHMVELDVQARQGDSGGPIFNSRGELAGVLFGAGEGTTMGSYGGQVDQFLASLAPNIGSNPPTHLAQQATGPTTVESAETGPSAAEPMTEEALAEASEEWVSAKPGDDFPPISTEAPTPPEANPPIQRAEQIAAEDNEAGAEAACEAGPIAFASLETEPADQAAGHWQSAPASTLGRNSTFENVKNILAAVGVVSLLMLVLKAAG